MNEARGHGACHTARAWFNTGPKSNNTDSTGILRGVEEYKPKNTEEKKEEGRETLY